MHLFRPVMFVPTHHPVMNDDKPATTLEEFLKIRSLLANDFHLLLGPIRGNRKRAEQADARAADSPNRDAEFPFLRF